MSTTLMVNANNDLFISTDGNLAITDGLTATLQAAQQAAQVRQGEVIFDVLAGIPFFDTAWAGVPNLGLFEAYLREQILAVDGVTGIDSLTTAIEGDAVTYAAEITTIYGTGSANGTL